MPSQQTRREDLETELRTESGLSGSLRSTTTKHATGKFDGKKVSECC